MSEGEKEKFAQKKIEEAFYSNNYKKRMKLAQEALEITENCIDA
jgi:hypothetical protein